MNNRISLLFSLLLAVLFQTFASAQTYFNPTGEKYPVLAWYTFDADHSVRSQFRQLAKAGFNISLSAYMTKDEALESLRQAKGTGVKLIVDCQEARNADAEFVNLVKGSDALAMYYLKDEPKKDYFGNLKGKIDRLSYLDSEHAGYINLLPIYATNEQLNADSYEDYLDTYIQVVHPMYISYDHYPFLRDSFREDFYDNLEIVSRKSRQESIPFWGFVRSIFSEDYYAIDEGRLRFQVFINMAYGAQGIQYFTYGVPNNGNTSAIVDTSFNKTSLYDIVKIINKEVQILGKYTLGANNWNILHLNEAGVNELAPFLDCIGPLENNLLLTRFDNAGEKYLLIVNKDFINTHQVSVTFHQKAKMINKKGRISRGRRQFINELKAGDWLLFRLK